MKTCSLAGCDAEVSRKSAKGLCRPHYRKLLKYGDATTVKLGRPIEVRFWEQVNKQAGGECWEWMGRKNRQGYGIFTIGHTDKMLAHRLSWSLNVEPITDDLHVLHRCDNPACVRPMHLFRGTQADNIADMIAKGRKVQAIGHRIGTTKLTPAQVLTIRASYKPGKKHMKGSGNIGLLSKQYSVGISTIRHIVQRRTWSYV